MGLFLFYCTICGILVADNRVYSWVIEKSSDPKECVIYAKQFSVFKGFRLAIRKIRS